MSARLSATGRLIKNTGNKRGEDTYDGRKKQRMEVQERRGVLSGKTESL